MTPIQRDAMIRDLMKIVGASLGTYLIQKGVLSEDQVTFIIANGAGLIAVAVAIGGWVWTIVSRRNVSMVAAVAQMPEVSKVEITKTDGGPALAAAANAAAGPTGTVTVAK